MRFLSCLVLFYALPSIAIAAPGQNTLPETAETTIGVPLKLFQQQHVTRVTDRVRQALRTEQDPVRRDALKEEANGAAQELMNTYEEFTGTSRFDNSLVEDEFRHNVGDALVRKRKGLQEDYFFFHQRRLWKVLSTLPAETNLEQLTKALDTRYGKGQKLSKDEKGEMRWIWQSEDTVLQLEDRRKDFGCFTITKADATLFEARDNLSASSTSELDPLVLAIMQGDTTSSVSDVVDDILDSPSEGTH